MDIEKGARILAMKCAIDFARLHLDQFIYETKMGNAIKEASLAMEATTEADLLIFRKSTDDLLKDIRLTL